MDSGLTIADIVQVVFLIVVVGVGVGGFIYVAMKDGK